MFETPRLFTTFTPMKIVIGSDHAGFDLKSQIIHHLKELSIEVIDVGTYSAESVDYPDFAHALCQQVLTQHVPGIVICGSGNGVNITANKYKGIRSALCWNEEITKLARLHNNANVMALPARFITVEEAQKCVHAFLNTPFEGGRHEKRVQKIEL